jgi:protein-L-isoaspartate(D-aspartate) O-methyltransferase
MVQPGGKVVGIEHLPELSAMSRSNLVKDPEHKRMMEEGELLIVTGDGRKGYPEEGTPPLRPESPGFIHFTVSTFQG